MMVNEESRKLANEILTAINSAINADTDAKALIITNSAWYFIKRTAKIEITDSISGDHTVSSLVIHDDDRDITIWLDTESIYEVLSTAIHSDKFYYYKKQRRKRKEGD